MIGIRRALLYHCRQFVERELAGLYSWDADLVREAIPLPLLDPDTGRPNRRNACREIVEVDLGDYLLRLKSSDEAPPLGAAELEEGGKVIVCGVIDPITWKQFSNHIRGARDHG